MGFSMPVTMSYKNLVHILKIRSNFTFYGSQNQRTSQLLWFLMKWNNCCNTSIPSQFSYPLDFLSHGTTLKWMALKFTSLCSISFWDVPSEVFLKQPADSLEATLHVAMCVTSEIAEPLFPLHPSFITGIQFSNFFIFFLKGMIFQTKL